MSKNVVARRYVLRVASSMVSYIAVLYAAVWLMKNDPPEGALRYVVAVSPAIPLIGVIVFTGLYLREESDEFLRTLLAQRMLWSTGATLVLAAVWGFFEQFGLAEHLPAYHLVTVWFILFGAVELPLRLRYR